eukprot:CAMPEP_0177676140 /NCGR_PEP_ID=MMETSP0447-20121125/27613_1 /TAXON_ID=0 /ORGANISM="Stygamoeba regulata, Strain BSH-02190019" /LENGTH=360 /DNA_ID=CAMNT_0019184649 /DNA_START=236 /DNA_END=1318 /DNA_ORIENTATION=+
MTDHLVNDGYLAVGYDTVHIDDCWMRQDPPRDSSGRLQADPTRFPSGMAALADYMHARGVKFGLYTAESARTCAGFPASAGNETVDAATFAAWGVDYLKVDGCGTPDYYTQGYAAMGSALRAAGRPIVYSCSWPAYLGDNEAAKPFAAMVEFGCNLWRNWADIQCNWASLSSIIAHWATYGDVLTKVGAPGHWNDPDMLLIGNSCISDDEARTQMAVWCVVAAPLIMGNDLTNVSPSHKRILLNKEAIAINQDPQGTPGTRVRTPTATSEVWARLLADGSVAVALRNTHDTASAAITVTFSDVFLGSVGPVRVRNVWSQQDEGTFTGAFTATVPPHGTAFVLLWAAPLPSAAPPAVTVQQ